MRDDARCSHCEERPAVCVGQYDNMAAPALACDECCGHGCEDGWCVQLEDALDDGPNHHLPPAWLLAARVFLAMRFGGPA